MRPIIRRMAFALLSGVVLAAVPARETRAQMFAAQPPSADPYAAPIAEASQRFGIPAAWIRAVMRAESAGDPRALSSAGAIGLMQVMPETWAELRARHRLSGDPFEPRDNILAGTAYLRELYDRYGSPGFLAAYNAGPGRYEASLAGRPLPAETRAYVAAIAPIIGGGGAANPILAVATDPLAWTHAPLFVAQPDLASGTSFLQIGRPSDAALAASLISNGFAVAPHPAGLFAVRTDSGVPR